MPCGNRRPRSIPGTPSAPSLETSGMHPPHIRPVLAATLALAALANPTPAHAGPCVSADLDLGTSVKRDSVYSGPYTGPTAGPSPLYIVGFRLRAGWRLDLGPVGLLPELGGGYDRERIAAPSDPGVGLPRAFGVVAFGLTDTGLHRETNEDAYAVAADLGLYAVADGVGGNAAGEVASRLAIDSVVAFFEDVAAGRPVPGDGQEAGGTRASPRRSWRAPWRRRTPWSGPPPRATPR